MTSNKICKVKNKDAKIISKDSFEKYLGLIISGDSKLKMECEGSGNDDCNNENDSIEIKGDIESKSEFRSACECLSSEATEIPDLSGDQAQQSLTKNEILRSASDIDPLARELHRQQSTDDDLDDTTSSVLDFSTSIADAGQSGIASPTASKGFKQQLSLRTPSYEIALQITTDSPVYHDLFGCPLTEHARLPVRCLDPREETISSTPYNELAAAERGGPVLERNLFGSEECGAGGDLSSAGGETVDERQTTSRTAAASDTFQHFNKATAVQEVTTTSEEGGDSTTSSPASGDLLLRTKEQTSKLQQGHTQRSSISSFLCSALSLSGEDTSPKSLSTEESTPGSSCSSKVAQIAAEIESRARHSGSGQVGTGKTATKPALFSIIYSSTSNCNSSNQATGNDEWSESSSLWRAAANEKQEQHQTPPSLSDIASSSLSRTFATGAHNASKTEQQVCAEQKPRYMIPGQSNGGRGGAVQETAVSRRTTLLLFIMTSLLLCAALLARVYGLSHFAVALERREAAMQALRHHLLPAQRPRHGRLTATSATGSADKLDELDVSVQLSDTAAADKSNSNVVDQLERRATHAAAEASEIAEKCSTVAAETTGNKLKGVVVVRSVGGVWRRLLARLRRAQQVTARVLLAPFRLLWRLGREVTVSKKPSK